MPSIILLSRGIALKLYFLLWHRVYIMNYSFLCLSKKCLLLRHFYRSYVDFFFDFSRISGNLSFILYSTQGKTSASKIQKWFQIQREFFFLKFKYFLGQSQLWNLYIRVKMSQISSGFVSAFISIPFILYDCLFGAFLGFFPVSF